MNVVFLDTVGLVALWDVSDQWHAVADAAYPMAVADRRRLSTLPIPPWWKQRRSCVKVLC